MDVDRLRQKSVLFRPKQIAALIRASLVEWNADNAPRLGAALAFYALLSLAPLLVLTVGVAALVFGKDAASGQLAWQVRDILDGNGAQAIQTLLLHAAEKPATGILATSLSALVLLWGSSSVVVELRDSLNTIWRVPAPLSETNFSAILRLLRERFYSFGLVLAVGLLLITSLLGSAWIAMLGHFFSWRLPVSESVLHAALFLASFLVITFLFAAIYKFVPDVPLEWNDVLVGAAITALIFTAGKQLIALYLGKTGSTSIYGAAGSLVVFLVWVYYSALLFFLGAEFTKVYARHVGSHSSNTAVLATPELGQSKGGRS